MLSGLWLECIFCFDRSCPADRSLDSLQQMQRTLRVVDNTLAAAAANDEGSADGKLIFDSLPGANDGEQAEIGRTPQPSRAHTHTKNVAVVNICERGEVDLEQVTPGTLHYITL